MMLLQPQVTLLDKFVIQQEAIPNLMTPIDVKQGQLHFIHRAADAMDSINENVSFYQIARVIVNARSTIDLFLVLQTQTMSISKTAILDQQTAEHNRARAISISRQKLNKSLSEPQIDVTKLHQKHQMQKQQTQEKQFRSSSVNSNHSEHSEEAEAKNGCAII